MSAGEPFCEKKTLNFESRHNGIAFSGMGGQGPLEHRIFYDQVRNGDMSNSLEVTR